MTGPTQPDQAEKEIGIQDSGWAQRAAIRNAILDFALAEAVQHGMQAVTLRAIARQVGITPTTVYRHFASLDELRVQLIEREVARLQAAIGAVQVDEFRGRERLRRDLHTLLRYAEEHRVSVGFLVGSTLVSDPDSALTQQYRDPWRGIVWNLVERAHPDAVPSPEHPLVDMISGALTSALHRSSDNQASLDAITAFDLADFIWGGLDGSFPWLLNQPFCVYVTGDDHEIAQELAAAIVDLFAVVEIEAVPEGEPEISSWFQRFKLRAKRKLAEPEMASRLEKIEHALELVAVHDPMSKVNVQHADAMARLLAAAEKTSNFVALAGSIVVVKHTDEKGCANVYAKTLSVAEVRAFERNQHLLKSPAEAMKHLKVLSIATLDQAARADEHGIDDAEPTGSAMDMEESAEATLFTAIRLEIGSDERNHREVEELGDKDDMIRNRRTGSTGTPSASTGSHGTTSPG